MNFPGIKPGVAKTITHTVHAQDTVGAGLPDELGYLLSSPGLAKIFIEASSDLVNELLPEGFISVGKSINLVHEHPSVVGATLEVSAAITAFDGYHVTLSLEVRDATGLVGSGEHVRSIVNQRWLQIKVHRRLENQ